MSIEDLQAHFKNKLFFSYAGHDSSVEKEAHLKLVQVLAYAPPGAAGVGWVEKTEKFYTATVTIRSPFRSFEAKAVGCEDRSAIKKALDRLEDEIFRWRSGAEGLNVSRRG